MKTIIRKRRIHAIEVLEYTSKKAHRLIFLQHGIHGTKEKIMNLLGVSFVKIGYHVVTIDAYKHGSRLEEPFVTKDEALCALDTMHVVKQTALDIKNIYQDSFKDTYTSFDMLGISMGGLIAYHLSTITTDIDHLIGMITSPQFLRAAYHVFPEEKQAEYKEKSESVIETVKKLDPSTKVHTMHFKRMIMMNGRQDSVIPFEQSESFYKNNPNLNILFRLYDTDHKINQAMHEDLLDILRNA